MIQPNTDFNDEYTLKELYNKFLSLPKKIKVVVIVEGGCVQAIQSNDPELNIIIVDYDGQDLLANRKEMAPGEFADVWPASVEPITLDL